jgi:hypothetical protein
LLRYAWAGPATVFGIALATLALWRGRVTVVDGVVEAYGPLLHYVLSRLIPLAGGASAMTFGHVVVGLSAKALDETRTHERVHVRQYERWGPLFVPAYLASSAWALACGRHIYLDNPFEREAFTAYRRRLVAGASGCVLEVRVGSGLNIRQYTDEVTHLIGLDPSPKLLSMARDAAHVASRPIERLEASVEALPLEDPRSIRSSPRGRSAQSQTSRLGCVRFGASSNLTAVCCLWSTDVRPMQQ